MIKGPVVEIMKQHLSVDPLSDHCANTSKTCLTWQTFLPSLQNKTLTSKPEFSRVTGYFFMVFENADH